MNKICVIGVYFGKLPKYFSLWLKSCENNPTIDFFLFCDQELGELPENVRYHFMTLKEMKHRAEAVLGFEVCLDRPYKCCDFKVIYGLIFGEYISQYEYWGHCDFDLIFGDLQSMFDQYDLYKFDRFLSLGHLSLYRNSDEVNHRYMCHGSACDYKIAFTAEGNAAFDELSGMTTIYLKNHFPIFTRRIFADIASVYHRYRVIEEYPLDVKPKNYRNQVFYWEDGKTYRAFYKDGRLYKEEYIYIHFKKRSDFPVEFDEKGVRAFYITNKGFFEKTGEVTLENIRNYNAFPGTLYEKWEHTRFDFLNQIERGKRFMRKGLKRNEQQ